jgi:hypothetical protein
MTMNEADDLEALRRAIDALRKENEELLATLRQVIRETHPSTVGEVDDGAGAAGVGKSTAKRHGWRPPSAAGAHCLRAPAARNHSPCLRPPFKL